MISTTTDGFTNYAFVALQALTDERRIRAFTQSEATSDPCPGGKFSMFGGAVQGASAHFHLLLLSPPAYSLVKRFV